LSNDEKLIWINKVVCKGNNYLVFINDTLTPITFTENQIVNYRIVKGNSFYKKDWDEIIKSLDEGVIFDKVVKYIDYKPRTEKEVFDFLDNLNIDDVKISNIIQKLKEINYINDDRYAKNFIEQEIRNQKGPNAIKHVLYSKGIETKVIENYLCNYNNELYFDNAYDMGLKTLKTCIGLPLQKQKESVYSRLYRMGYDSLVINKVLSLLEYTEVDLIKLKKEFNKIKEKENNQNKIIQKLLTKGYEYTDIIKVIEDTKE
jgi:regulatory protein